jgi:hypothetical protein
MRNAHPKRLDTMSGSNISGLSQEFFKVIISTLHRLVFQAEAGSIITKYV